MHDDAYYMRLALEEAQKAYDLEEVPIGAVLVDSEGEVVARGHNMREVWHDATAHALRDDRAVPDVRRSHRHEPRRPRRLRQYGCEGRGL